MSKSTFSNAAGLLAILIARGIINYKNLIPSQQERDELNEMKEGKRTKAIKAKITNAIKKVKGQEEPEGITQLRETLTQINNRYPRVPADINDDVIKNISSVVATYSPLAARIEGDITDPYVTLPQPIAQRMQEEILQRRGQEVKQLTEQKKLKTRLKTKKTKLESEKQLTLTQTQRGDRYKQQSQELQEEKRQLELKIADNETALKLLRQENSRMVEEQKQKQSAEIKKALTLNRAKITKMAKTVGQQQEELKQLTITENAQTRDVVIQTGQDIQRQIAELPRTIRGTQREIIQPREYKYDEGRTGLGLNPAQRKKLKAIVAKETRPEIAEAVDMIAGDEIKANPSQIMTALTGLALSVAIPIPSPVLSAMLDMASRETGFDAWFNSMFAQNRITDSNNFVLTQNANVNSLQQVEQAMPGTGVEAKIETQSDTFNFEQAVIYEVRNIERGPSEGKHDAGPGSIDLGGKADKKQQRDNRGRFIKKIADTQAGAVLGGAATYAITGSVASAVTGAGVGGLVGALSPAISRIGEALAERLPDTIPTTTGIQRAVQRQITTDTKDVNIPIPKVARRPANEQETAITYNRLDELDNEYNDLRNRQRRLEADMMSNVNSGVSNTQLGLTQLARSTSQQIRENRDTALRLQDDIDNARLRVDINRVGVGIPIPRRTTDDEKALVPFNEAEERTTYDKKKALAVAGAVGSAVVAAGVERSGMFKERPIEVPATIYNQQQGKEFDTAMPNMARGLLRPKFIMPDADILQPSNQELAADALEFAMFDFVEPSSEGAEGTNQTNILKAFQKENENIRYRGAGVVVNSLFGNDANDLTTQQINKMFLGSDIPPMIFSEIQQNLSEYEVNQFDVNNEITGIEFFSPYNNFTNVNPGLGENNFMLFDVVP